MSDLDEFIERYRQAIEALCNGDANAQELLWSHRDDATLANPLGAPVRGWAEIKATTERAASLFRDGEFPAFDVISRVETPEFAYQVDIERVRAKAGGSDELSSITLRVTTIFRREDGEWKIVHRHADPITIPQGVDSIVQK